MGLRRYLARKTMWYLGALVAAVVLNFLLPRLIPGNPVDVIVSQAGPRWAQLGGATAHLCGLHKGVRARQADVAAVHHVRGGYLPRRLGQVVRQPPDACEQPDRPGTAASTRRICWTSPARRARDSRGSATGSASVLARRWATSAAASAVASLFSAARRA